MEMLFILYVIFCYWGIAIKLKRIEKKIDDNNKKDNNA